MYQPGMRIELDHCDDEYTILKPGDQGTFLFVDDMGTLHVEWDNGSRLGLIPGIDAWHRVEEEG